MRVLSIVPVLFTCLMCHGQSIITMGGITMGHVCERDWTAGRGTVRFGLQQYHQTEYDNRARKMTFENRYTIVHCGTFKFSVRTRAWAAASLGGVGLALVVMVAFLGASRIARILNSRTEAEPEETSRTV